MLLMPGKYHDVEGRWLRVLRLREKRTYRSQEVQDTYVKKTRDIWLLGPPQSGKSSAMQRLLAHSAQIWARWPVLSCLATDPLSRWCDQAPLQTVVDAQGRSYLSLKGEEKIDALSKSAQTRGLSLSPGVLPYLLTHFRRDMQSLSAMLDALDRYSLETQRPITMPLLRELLQLGDANTLS